MSKKILSLMLCICMFTALASVTASAAAVDISVKSAAYYDNGDVKSLNIDFGWDSAPASSRLTLMTERLRSAGEEGTNSMYSDFTDLGHYGRTFSSWDEVIAQSNKFGMVLYTDEHKMESGENTLSLHLEKGDIPINVDETYYVYLWTNWGGHHYPDNLFMIIKVKNGQLTYASATGRNEYGSFTALKGSVASTPAFQDVKKSDYFFEPVSWAVDKGITSGTSMVLDPNPPEDYRKQPDWYGTLTPPASMSDERLLAEYENIQKVIEDFRARDIYMSDGPYSRQLDLWSEASRRDLLDE